MNDKRRRGAALRHDGAAGGMIRQRTIDVSRKHRLRIDGPHAARAQPAHAADWPTRPVTVVVPLGAGGNTDMMARLGAQRLSEKFGQPFVVENRPSAGGALGTGQVAAAAPDGYTILFSPSSMLLLTPMVQKVPFDADEAARAGRERRHRHADDRDPPQPAGEDARRVHRPRQGQSRQAQLRDRGCATTLRISRRCCCSRAPASTW